MIRKAFVMLETKRKKQMKFSSPYRLMRLHQPTGIWLLFLPCLFGIFLAAKFSYFFASEIIWTIFLFFLGSIVMRSAGCIINDLLDQKFDALVERTKNRPLVAKEISQKEALVILAILLLIGFQILCWFNIQTIISGLVAIALVICYPLMKRITYFPQVFLGLTFNYGILMSSLAMLKTIRSETILLFFAAIIWTVIYDTIYAFQDIEDDMRFGVKSTAIKFRKRPKTILSILSVLMFSTLVALGLIGEFYFGYFLIILCCAAAQIYQIQQNNFSPKQALELFKNNVWIGAGIALAIFIG